MYNNSLQANYRADVKTAEQWREFIKGGRSKTSRKVANNTVVRDEPGTESIGGAVVIRLHQTDIVTISDNGNIKLYTGGWQTVTTKERLNRYTNAGITQKAGVWYMRDGSLYYDGMVIKADGTPKFPRHPEKHEKALKTIKADAKKYAHDFVEALKAGKIDYPDGGNCWACLGMLPGADDFHIREHIRESYFVPQLLVNAGRAAGYRDEQIGLMGMGGHRVFIDPERILYRYIVKQLQRAL